jgi:hypothetical protein
MPTTLNRPLTIHCITALERARLELRPPHKTDRANHLPGHQQFICLALDEVARKDPELRQACNYLSEVIEKRLGGALALENWLLNHVPEAKEIRPGFAYQAYLTRRAWIDSLIDELENQR